jgi:ribonuclease T2
MKPKMIARILIALIAAAYGAWHYQGGNQSGGNAPAQSSNRQEHRQGGGQPHQGKHGGGQHASNQTTGDFDYYLVSLSWSPAYCSTHPQDKNQCGGRGFGFVLHGLWPQKSSGGWPENCPATSEPSRAVIQKTMAFMPSEKLINHEWTKHGTCSGLTGDQYLELADKAYSAIKIPVAFQAPATSIDMSAEKILAAFVQTNPGIAEESLSVKCSKGELEEVRVCVDTQLKPKVCGKGIRSQCGKEPVQVRAMR